MKKESIVYQSSNVYVLQCFANINPSTSKICKLKIFVFNSLRLVYGCCSKNLLSFQFQISDLNYQLDTKYKHHTLKKKKKIRTQLHQAELSHWKTLSNLKITQTQKLELKPQIKINQSNT